MKKFLFFIALLFISLLNPSRLNAEGEFNTDYDVTYKVKEDGVTEVTNKITLTNVFSNLYATSYSVVLSSINPTNVRAVSESGNNYLVDIIKEENRTSLHVNFPDQVVGKDKSRTFYLIFDEPSFAVRTGEVWEISIPRIDEGATFNSYYLRLVVPESFGQEAYISPNPRSKSTENGSLVYGFNKQDVEKTGIVAGFGAFQVFSFNLSYHLENPLTRTARTEITLPPDTAYQKIYYENINPRPVNMYIDDDGNWIAEYELKARERVDVMANGNVQIFSDYRPFLRPSNESLNNSLVATEYWQVNNPKIIELAKKYKTPRDIYNYVSTTLKYNYGRVKPNVERLGAVGVLDTPDSAICMEFTDLFIAIARAAGIPAREINGFAYTENPEVQPLSLVNDVLHSWPEYYDSSKQVWVPVDPTWGSTTGGIDYFSKLDLRHFTFVIHGKDDKEPYAAGSYKLGANPQKDVYVSFGSLPQERNSKLSITASLEGWIPLISNRLNIEVSNPGPVAVYDQVPLIYFDNKKIDSESYIASLLPFQKYQTYIEIPFSFLGAKTPEKVTVTINGESVTLPTNKSQVVVYNLLFVFIVGILIMLTILIRLKKIDLSKLKQWILPKKTS